MVTKQDILDKIKNKSQNMQAINSEVVLNKKEDLLNKIKLIDTSKEITQVIDHPIRDNTKQEIQSSDIADKTSEVVEGAKLVNESKSLMNMQQKRLMNGATNLSEYAKTLSPEKIEEIKSTSAILHPELLEKKDPDAKYYFGKFALGTSEAVENLADATVALSSNLGIGKAKALEKITSIGGLAPNSLSERFKDTSDRFKKIKENAYSTDLIPVKEVSQILANEYEPNKVEALAGDVLSGIGGMLPTIATNLLVPGAGYGVLGMQSAGGGTKQAYENTGNLGAKEEIYGLLSGLAEVGVEKLSGGIGGLGDGAIDDIASKLIKNGFIRSATGEGIEEAVTTLIDPYLQRLTYDKAAEGGITNAETWKEATRSAIIGSLTSMVLQGGSAAINLPQTVQQSRAEIRNSLEGLDQMLPNYENVSETASTEKNVTSELPTMASQQAMLPANQTEGKTAQNGNIGQIEKNVENNDALTYNNGRGGINEGNKLGRMLERMDEPSRIYEENKSPQAQKYTRAEYKQFEKSIRPIGEERISNTERELIQHYKNKYNKDVVLFDEKENQGYIGGASLTDRNKIYIDINSANEFGYNMVASHEVMESDILYNSELKEDLIKPIISKIINDPNFGQQKMEFWSGQDGNMPSDYLIAKDIICDRFAELDNNEALSYKNVLSQETNMTLDYGISNFREAINKNVQADEQSAFSMPENTSKVKNVYNINEDISYFKSSESNRSYMNLNENISMNKDSKHNKVGLSQIEDAINDIVNVRVGKFRQRAYGIYKNRAEIIRIKQKNDIPVTLHELTHHFDKQMGLSVTGKFDSELMPIAVVKENADLMTKRAEGVAEFGRYYMTDPSYAKAIAPKYFEAFEEQLNKNPEVKVQVEKLQNMVSDYVRQSPLNRVLSHIDYGDDSANIFVKAKDRALEFKKSFRKNFFDDLDPLKQVINDITDGKKLPVDKDAYAKLRLNRGVTGRVQVALEYGITNNNGEKIGKSLKEIIEPIQNDIDGFVAYISALRAKDLETRNVESGFNLRDIDEILSEYSENETFNKASKELYEYQNQILEKTLVDSGIITKAALKAYNEANPHYVPFYRVMDKNFKQSKDSLSKSPKKIKGSTRDIINPLESIIKNTYSYYMISEKNNAYKALFDLANEYDGTGKWFDKVPTDMTGQKVTANDIKGILDKLDLDKSDIDYNELFTTIFKPSNYQKGNIVTVMDKGKPVHYEIMDEGLYKILAQGNKRTENFITNILSSGATALRVGATHTLEFTLRNPIKDTFDAFTYSKNGFVPVIDTIRGIFDVAGKSDLYYKWLESGGSGSSYTNAQRTTLRNTLKGIMPEVYSQSKIDTILDSASHPLRTYLNLIGELSNVTEEGTRVGEFRRALKNNKTAGEGALESRDITVDFSRGGESTKEANRYIAFLNANVQGLDKMFTAFKERPVATTIKGIVAFMLPSMLIAGVTEEDDRDKVPQWEKDSHWIFFINGTPVRIPKPQGVGGAFANLGESIIDYMRKKDPEVFKHFMFETMLSYMPVSDLSSLMPNALMTPFEIGANKSFFKDSKIVSQSMENRSPEYQYDEYTSTIAKQIGKTFKVSPKKVDYLIGGYFGNLGKDVATLLGLPIDWYENATNGKKQTYATTNSVLKKIPLIKGFIANDYANPLLDSFYDNKSQALTDYTDAKFKYSDGKLSINEKKELELLKNINSVYTSAYSKIKEKNEEKEKIENGSYTNKTKNRKLLLISKEIDNIAKKANEEAEILRKRAKLPTLKK